MSKPGNWSERFVRRAGALVGAIALGSLVAPATAWSQGDACPNAQFRVGLPAAHLPDCRAYEQVSPVDKNGADVTLGAPTVSFGPYPVQATGGAAVFRSNGAFAGTPWGGGQAPTAYFSRRGDDGWTTQPTVGRPRNNAAQIVSLRSIRPDFGAVLLNGADSLLDEPPPVGGLYLRDTVTGALERLVAGSGLTGQGIAIAPFKWSADSEHLTFTSASVLATGDVGVPPSGAKAYEIVDGMTRLVSKLPGETPAVGQVGSYGTSPITRSVSNAVSSDGSHVFFTNPVAGTMGTTPTTRQSIYRRTNGTATVLATPSKRTDCAGDPTCGGDGIADPAPDPLPGAKKFETATTDGNRVFFTSPEELTDDANTAVDGSSCPGQANPRHECAARDLYRYDFEADELVAISAETNDVNGAQVQGVAGISQDGDWVYYVALGQVLAGQGTLGQPNLYAWHDDGSADGETRFIATLVPMVSAADRRDQTNWVWSGSKTSRVSDDGGRLLFTSVGTIPGHDSGGFSQVYLYDWAADGGDGAIECVSCNPNGDPPLGGSDLGQVVLDTEEPDQYPRNLLGDGSRVFFDSADALVDEDLNEKVDAYMWEDGELRLLSTGKSGDHSRFYGASADGTSVFLVTREQLVGWDGDTAMDLYAAKVGGGFAEPVSPFLDDCASLADRCQAPGTGTPLPHQESSDGQSGGNGPGATRVELTLAGVSAKARRRAAKSGVLRLRVRTNNAGTIRVAAKARVAGKRRTVGSARKRATGAGQVSVRLRLSKAARRHLANGKALKLALTVKQPEARPLSRQMTLKRAGR